MRVSDIVAGLSMAILAIILSYLMVYGGLGPIAPYNLRPLAVSYLNYTYNPWEIKLSAMAPEGVTSIVWDYRGLDTYFETSVLFIALIGLLALFRGSNIVQGISNKGLSLIVKTTTKIVAPLILVAGVSLAYHGHLTPGGGFQGGSFMTVAIALIVVAFSIEFIAQKKITIDKLLIIRWIGLIFIVLTAVFLLIKALIFGGYAYIFQNMIRIGSQYTMPSWFLDRPLGGILFFFNVSESVAVVGGLSLGIVLLSLRDEEVKHVIGGEEHE
ncbi:MnhB domain-containing protein [Ignisphaera sp. 4213-co]|uniref:MnhB domain-containing protein n=1 Tax=Ignisphaera cupida TaxID=3050454 RepID=A0ABD4Z6G9_9CREN|nr:MnhB domain-containing protein [Ignisphaera sp. 4213-co]MDK6028587.1 MnhB domain-containing protein [Ignisphaera sp. 4213-co]